MTQRYRATINAESSEAAFAVHDNQYAFPDENDRVWAHAAIDGTSPARPLEYVYVIPQEYVKAILAAWFHEHQARIRAEADLHGQSQPVDSSPC